MDTQMSHSAEGQVGAALQAAGDVEAVRATAEGIGGSANCTVTVSQDGKLNVDCADRFGLTPRLQPTPAAPEAAPTTPAAVV